MWQSHRESQMKSGVLGTIGRPLRMTGGAYEPGGGHPTPQNGWWYKGLEKLEGSEGIINKIDDINDINDIMPQSAVLSYHIIIIILL